MSESFFIKERIALTQYGLVRGFHGQDPSVTVFKGIPYAAPPIGKKRFMPPFAAQKWEGVKDCFLCAPAPMQGQPRKGAFYQKEFYPVDRLVNEDCLYLNIWTPAQDTNEKLPVMVWIHGGGFGSGSADEITFNGDSFAKRGVILVTLGFRVGVFSSFCNKAAGYKGNCGLKDILFALKWVRNNISAFGGDSANVTVFGQSAGGAAVQCVIAADKNKTLFDKAIIQSAGGINSLGGKNTFEQTESLYDNLLKSLDMSVDDFVKCDAGFINETVRNSSIPFNHYPFADGELLKDSPGNLIAKGEIADIPYLTGSVIGDYFFDIVKKGNNREEQMAILKRDFGYLPQETLNEILPTDINFESFLSSVNLLTRIGPPISFAKSRLKYGTQPVFVYHFNRKLPNSEIDGYHSYELWYIFGTLQYSHRKFTGLDFELSNAFCDYWCNFAKYGTPNCSNSELTYWQPYTNENHSVMNINELGCNNVSYNGNKLIRVMTETREVE